MRSFCAGLGSEWYRTRCWYETRTAELRRQCARFARGLGSEWYRARCWYKTRTAELRRYEYYWFEQPKPVECGGNFAKMLFSFFIRSEIPRG